MRVVFAGTPAFAALALDAIARASHDVALVLTQPDRPAGRGLRLMPSAVAQAAQRLGLRVEKPPSLRSDGAVELLRSAAPDVMVVAAYGLMLPPGVLAVPSRGCLNIHASLLPRWRGAAPIQRALLAGDAVTGICIMRMEEGLDTGPVLVERTIDIAPRDTAGSLTEKLSEKGAVAIVYALSEIDRLVPRPQDDRHATYASKITKGEARIDWHRSSEDLDRMIRAFNPAPGAHTALRGQNVKIWDAQPAAGAARPGEIIEAAGSGLVVGCGRGALRISSLQRSGGKRLSAAEFIRGEQGLAVGAMMGDVEGVDPSL